MNTLHKSNEKISEMFDGIAPKYDLLNHLLSANLDKVWRKNAIRQIDDSENIRILDIATGTGDLALEAAKLKSGEIVGVDISERMLDIARKKVLERNTTCQIIFKIASAENLPFDAESFDYVMVAFGVRNFENLDKGLLEILRVLKPNGKVVILEFSKPDDSFFKSIYYFYFKHVLPFIGRLVSKSSFAYSYLPDSVNEFPYGNDFLLILQESGFKNTYLKKQTFGVATIYCGNK